MVESLIGQHSRKRELIDTVAIFKFPHFHAVTAASRLWWNIGMTLFHKALAAFNAEQRDRDSDARVERDKVHLLVNGFRLAIASTTTGPVLTATFS